MLHSHYSILESTLKPEDIIRFCADINQPVCITDTNSISGCIAILKLANQMGIRSILGAEILTNIGYLTLVARNTNGWKNLVRIISKIEFQNNLDELGPFNDIIAISGYSQSTAQFFLFKNGQVNSDAKDDVQQHLDNLSSIFDYFYCGIDTINDDCQFIKCCAESIGVDVIQWNPRFYDISNEANFKLITKLGNHQLRSYNNGTINNTYVIPQQLLEQIENYNLLSKPKLPKFSDNDTKLLREICRQGWKRLSLNLKPQHEQQIYINRINEELSIIESSGLEGYFLTVQDYVWWAKNNGILTGPARGSAAGCLVSYLTGITAIDPIQYNLSFSRFYCAGRNSKDNISLPDIDVDFEVSRREDIINYIKSKYGNNKVSHIATFGRLQGRGALKEVLKYYNVYSNDQINKITENIPDFAKISDKLEESDESSILRWVLQNEPTILKDYCVFNESTHNLEGPCEFYLSEAIKLEGTIRNRSKHASGITISNEPIGELCPVVNETALLEMNDLESLGFPKLDILGLSCLDKINYTLKLIHNNYD